MIISRTRFADRIGGQHNTGPQGVIPTLKYSQGIVCQDNGLRLLRSWVDNKTAQSMAVYLV